MFFPCRRIWILFLSLETGFLSHNIVPLNKNFAVYFVRDMRHRQAAPDKACEHGIGKLQPPRPSYVPGGTLLTRHDKFGLSRSRALGVIMTDDNENSGSPFTVRATADSHFAWIRTRLALENTLLAWVRTAASLISFGFTIVQFFQRLPPPTHKVLLPGGPRDLGLALMLAGVVALAIATLQYRSLDRYLRRGDFGVLVGQTSGHYKSATPAMAALLFVIGLVAFGTVLLRLT
jgi:putative membrane protein